LTLSTPSLPRSWQPCANAGPTDPRKAPLNAGPVVVRRDRRSAHRRRRRHRVSTATK
jgi:hypothetical protein